MADLLISPGRYTAPGAVPRKLLAGVFVVVAGVAMAMFLLTAPAEPLMTGDEKAREALRQPDAVRTQSRGNAQWVDDAAAAASAPPRRIAAAPAAPGDVPGAPTPPPVLPALPPHPVRGGPDTFPGPSDADAAAVERERTARGAGVTVFDEAAGPGKAPAGEDGLARLPGDVLRQLGGGPPPSNALGPVVEAIKAVHGGGAAASPSAAAEAREWTREIATPAQAADDVLRARPPVADWMLDQGTVIPCVLTRRLNSDLPGVVTARVSMDVYDSRTSRRLLLPKGSLLSGAYNHAVQPGQSRLQFAFTRLKLPDGTTFDLPGAPGSDGAGQAGIDGDVDRHFFRSFGAALLLGVLADQVTRVAALPRGGVNGQGGVSATGQVFVDTARAELERHKDIPSTVTVPEGTRLHVEVVRDMVFDRTYREAP